MFTYIELIFDMNIILEIELELKLLNFYTVSCIIMYELFKCWNPRLPSKHTTSP